MASRLWFPLQQLQLADIGGRVRKGVVYDDSSEDDEPLAERAPKRQGPSVIRYEEDEEPPAPPPPPPQAGPSEPPPEPLYRILEQGKVGSVTARPVSTVLDHHAAEAKHFVGTHVSVVLSRETRPSQYLVTQIDRGLAQAHGWMFYARASRDIRDVPAHPIQKDDMVGLLLVGTSPEGWVGRARLGMTLTVYALGAHDGLRRSGMARVLWAELERQIALELGNGKLTVIVEGGPCLNNPASRNFYESLGFRQPCDNKAGLDDLRAYLVYQDGRRV